MQIWHSIVLGIVEGVTEFLPISSTGHLILAGDLLSLPANTFSKSFDIIIQLGAIASVVLLYWKKLWNITTIKKLIVGFIPTGVIGLLLYKFVKTYLLGNTSLVLWSLLIGGIALIALELWQKRKGNTKGSGAFGERIQERIQDGAQMDRDSGLDGAYGISYKQAATVGLFQAMAVVPGVSRSAATIFGGLLLGIKRVTIVEFSFLLAVPTMLAASGLDLVKNYSSFSSDQFGVLAVGFVTSFIVALITIKFLLSYIKRNNFIPFGIYRIFLAIIFAAYLYF